MKKKIMFILEIDVHFRNTREIKISNKENRRIIGPCIMVG